MSRQPTPAPRGVQQGAGLVEVLVTMVIITIGLLGVAGLQMAAFNSSYGTLQRQVASMQVQDAAERLWSNLCALATSESSIRSNITSAWIAAHPATTASDRVTLPNRNVGVTSNGIELLSSGAGSLTYRITVTWENDRISKISTTADPDSKKQSVSQIVQLPTMSCPT